jgi:single-strand DNA-binding protein
MAGDINRVTIVGRLTRDPELRHLPSGTPVLQLGVAVNGRQRDDAGNWTDKPNFFDVKVFGNQAETLAQHLGKGRRIGVDGRLDWSSWEAQDGSKRSKVEIIANSVQFLDSRGDAEGGGERQFVPAAATADTSDFGGSAADDDIPF